MNHHPCTGVELLPSPLTPQYTVSSITVLAVTVTLVCCCIFNSRH